MFLTTTGCKAAVRKAHLSWLPGCLFRCDLGSVHFVIFCYFANSLDSQPCSSGYYSLTGSTSCTECPAGYECPTTDQSPLACTPGLYSTGLQTACTECAAGYACPSTTDGSEAYTCPSGEYSILCIYKCVHNWLYFHLKEYRI